MAGTLQERRRRYVAGEISRTAMRLFAERGFDEVTVDDIAEAVGISSRTFTRYFSSKDDVVLQYQRRVQERLVEALAARPAAEGPVTALRNSYLATSTVAPADREIVRMQSRFLYKTRALQARAHGERTVDMGPVVALLAERMGVDPERDPRPEVLAASMSAAAGAAFHRWVRGGSRGDPAASVGEALALLELGLAQLDDVGAELRETA